MTMLALSEGDRVLMLDDKEWGTIFGWDDLFVHIRLDDGRGVAVVPINFIRAFSVPVLLEDAQ